MASTGRINGVALQILHVGSVIRSLLFPMYVIIVDEQFYRLLLLPLFHSWKGSWNVARAHGAN